MQASFAGAPEAWGSRRNKGEVGMFRLILAVLSRDYSTPPPLLLSQFRWRSEAVEVRDLREGPKSRVSKTFNPESEALK